MNYVFLVLGIVFGVILGFFLRGPTYRYLPHPGVSHGDSVRANTIADGIERVGVYGKACSIPDLLGETKRLLRILGSMT